MKKVLITGGTRGLGKDIAKIFAENGYEIYLNYFNNDDEALKTKKEIFDEYQVEVKLLKGDISKEEVINSFKINNLDVLVCNAGIDNVCDIEDKTYESFKRVIEVNLLSNFLLTQKFGLEMESNGHGTIIYINSDNVIDSNDFVTLEYDVSKAGLLMLAKDYAKYFKNVKIHTIAPGWMDTKMNDIPDEVKDEFSFVPTTEVAKLVLKQVNVKESGNVEVIR